MFSVACVCLSVCSQGRGDWRPCRGLAPSVYDTGDSLFRALVMVHTHVQGPSPGLQDKVKHVQLGPHCTGPRTLPYPPPSAMFKLVHYEVWTIGERALGIQL